jgi:hypothetical protein
MNTDPKRPLNVVAIDGMHSITSTKSGKTLFDFDIAKSKRECPEKKHHFGRKHKIRKVVPVENILILDENGIPLQPREEINLPKNQTILVTSLRMRGWIHNQEPLFVEPHPDNNKIYILVSGFNRYGAIDVLGWTHVLVDVYEDALILEDQVLFKYRVNNDNLPSAPNKDIDFVKAAVEAIDKNAIIPVNNLMDDDIVPDEDYTYTDEDIAGFLRKAVSTSDGTLLKSETAIFKKNKKGKLDTSCLVAKVRKQRGIEKHMKSLDGKTAPQVLKELGKGYGGLDGFKTTGEIAFVFPPTNPSVLRTTFWQGVQYYLQYGVDIDVYGYIETPSSMTLKQDRKDIVTVFESFLDIAQEIVSTCNSGIDTDIIVRDIFKLKGALPQDLSKDPSKGGLPKETTIIKL